MEITSAVTALTALAHNSRLAVFRLLVEAGPAGMAASAIAERLEIAPSSLSFHLKELHHASMVTATPQGRSIIYSAQFSTMHALLAYLIENCCAGTSCSPRRSTARKTG